MDFRFKSYGVKKPICKLVRVSREPFLHTFGTNEGQQLPEAQQVGRMLLQRLATGATSVKQARYKQLPTDYLQGLRGTCTCMRSIPSIRQ